MPVAALFGLSVLMSFGAWALVARRYVWPYLAAMPRSRALELLCVPQLFRFIGLVFLIGGVVSDSLPRSFARPAAYGDLVTSLLAWGALLALSRRWAGALALAWVLNVWGTADLLYAFYQGTRHADPRMFGAAVFIPTVLVPLMLCAHALSFAVLLRTSPAPLGVSRR